MSEEPEPKPNPLRSLLDLARWAAAGGACVSLWYACPGMLQGGSVDEITIALALLAAGIGPVAVTVGALPGPRLRWTEKLAVVVLLGSIFAWSVGNVAAVRGPAVRMDYELGGSLEIANRFDLLGPDIGPQLLRLVVVTDSLRADLEREFPNRREDMALWYAARRLQGLSAEDILAAEQGPRLLLGLLAAESNPPSWWADAAWLGENLAARPDGSFRLGLLDSASAQQRLRALWDDRDPEDGSLPLAFRKVARDHVGLLDRVRLDQIAAARIATQPGSQWALEPSRLGRQQLGTLLQSFAEGQQVGLRLVLAEDFDEGLEKAARLTLEGLFASLGYRAVEGEQVVVELAVVPRDFSSHSFAWSKKRKTTVRKGPEWDYALTLSMMVEQPDQVVHSVDRQTFRGSMVAPVAVMRVRVGDEERLLEGRPYLLTPLGQGEDAGAATCDATSEQDRKRYGLSLSALVFGSWNSVY